VIDALRRRGIHASLREHLLAVVLIAMLPLGMFAGMLVLEGWRAQEDDLRTSAIQNARTMATAMRAELDASIRKLEVLALSDSLQNDRLAEFHHRASVVVGAGTDWVNVVVSDAAGTPLLNTSVPYGSALPAPVSRDFRRTVMETRRPAVSDLFTGRVQGRVIAVVAVPVIHEGEVRNVLSATLNLDRFGELLGNVAGPKGIAAVMDGEHRYVWRSRDTQGTFGAEAPREFIDAMRQGAQGSARLRSRDGEMVYAAWADVPGTSWTVAVGTPTASVEMALRYQLALMGLGWLMCALFGMAVAIAFGRRLTRAIEDPAERAEPVSRRRPIAAIASTVTELVALGDALRHASKRVLHEAAARAAAEADNRAKDEFLAMLGHELRNPLAAIANASHVVKRLPAGAPEAATANAVIVRQAQHLGRIIDDLLDVSRVITGKIALDRAPIDLAAHVREVNATLTAAGRLQRHQVTLDLAPAWIDGDATRVEQVVTNLVANAVTYTPAGGHVRITVHGEGTDAVLSVADDGEGISADAMPHLFELFFQADQTLGRTRGGLGIGLTLVRRIVELHGGTVAVESEGAGRGSRFVVRFPAREAPAVRLTGERAAGPVGPARRVLVIEDNDDARHTLRQLLELKGHAVVDAPDGPSGLLAAEEFRPDVALIDIGMPGMDGYAVARALRERQEGPLRLVALSGYGLPEHRRRAAEAGFDLHLVKPVGPDALDRALMPPIIRAA